MEFVVVLIAACGGVFGALIGPLPAFIFTGITGLIGVAFLVIGVPFDFMGVITFGVFFGPHISFAGAAAATAYARKRGYMESGKDIFKPLGSLRKPDVIVVGGIMGALGYIVNCGLATAMPGKIDTIALTVFIIAIIAKVIFGNLGIKEVFGVVPDDVKKLGGRFSPKAPGVWIGYMNSGFEKVSIAIGAGGVSAYVTYMMLQNEATASAAVFVGFVVSAASLIFLQFGAPIPVTHHVTIGASYAVLVTGSLAWGFAGALIGIYLGDFFARLFYGYGDTHVDPPAMSIASTSFILLAILPALNIYELGDIVAYAVIAAFVLIGVVEELIVSKDKKSVA